MFDKISEKVTDAMVQQNTIQEENRALYSFGLQQGAFLLGGFLLFLLIGWCFGMPCQTLLYLIFYMPLRMYAGGYHARTQTRCYVLSCVMLVIVLAIMKFAGQYTVAYLMATIIAGVCVFLLSPVEDENKPLDDKEVSVYSKRARSIASTEMVVCVLAKFLHTTIFLCISSAVITSGILVLIGWAVCKKKKRGKKVKI